ncbi:MAG: hypothetical protein JW982_03050 [Spirochaetes bacterium]|nr:hypothetical protein [Spirochaetota bacterium]
MKLIDIDNNLCDKNYISDFLRSTEFSSIADTIAEIEGDGQILHNIYKMGNDSTGYFSIKKRNLHQKYIADSIDNLNIMNDESGIFIKYKKVYKTEDCFILVSDWIDGKNLHPDFRNKLPLLFAELAKFNHKNIISGPFTSMYADGAYSDSADELVDRELNYHLTFWVDDKFRKVISEKVQFLKTGLPCLINEDLNLGNMKIMQDNRIVFIDTEWLQRNINLYQFDHVDYFCFDKPEWYSISGEAGDSYTSYFKELPVSVNDANRQIQAFEILKVLRQNTYWRFFTQKEKYGLEVERLQTALDCLQFVR